MTEDDVKEQDLDDLRWVLSTAQGQRFCARIIDRWARLEGVGHETGEERSSAFNAGMRDIGSRLLAAIEDASSAPRFDQFTLQRNEYRRECRGAPRPPPG